MSNLLAKVATQEIELTKKLDVFAQDADEALAYLREFVIDDAEQYAAAARQRTEYRDVLDQFEAARKEIVAPHESEIKRVNDKVRPVNTFLKTAVKLLSDTMGTYVARREETTKLALEQAQQLAAEGDLESAQQALILAQEEAPQLEGVSVIEEWDFEITDVNAIPRQYMAPDLVRIRAVVKAAKREGGDVIPGVRAFARKSVRQRRAVQK